MTYFEVLSLMFAVAVYEGKPALATNKVTYLGCLVPTEVVGHADDNDRH
jgi:hypothetical protein